jgi:zinc/manganese transport system substrate-binding protein
MSRFCCLLVLLAVSLLPASALADLRVVATTGDLAALAKAIGGRHAEVSVLALHTQDPHFVDARPHLALDLARADLLITVGLGLEVGWLPTLQTGSRNGKIQNGRSGLLDCSRFADVIEAPTGKVDRSMGDIHPGGNPHYMYDPRRAAQVAAGIARRMGELDPQHAADYQRGLAAFNAQLASARKRWEQDLALLRGAKLIAYHRSLSYLADWLGAQIVAQLEPKPGIPPNPRHVAHVLTVAREQGVKLVVQEAWYPSTTGRVIAERAGAKLVLLPGATDFNHGQTYVEFISELVKRLSGQG